MSVVIGIDPGAQGGLAVIAGGVADAWRYPGDIPAAAALLGQVIRGYGLPQRACIERVGAMPKQGVSSTFKFGANYGGWQGILSMAGVPYVTVTPSQWQKAMLDAGTGETKARSLSMARRLYPNVALAAKADDGKADALHLARWAQQTLEAEGAA